MVATSKMYGYEDKSIFLPAAGIRLGTSVNDVVSNGYYLSSTLYNRDLARYVYFRSNGYGTSFNSRRCGFSVRPVTE